MRRYNIIMATKILIKRGNTTPNDLSYGELFWNNNTNKLMIKKVSSLYTINSDRPTILRTNLLGSNNNSIACHNYLNWQSLKKGDQFIIWYTAIDSVNLKTIELVEDIDPRMYVGKISITNTLPALKNSGFIIFLEITEVENITSIEAKYKAIGSILADFPGWN